MSDIAKDIFGIASSANEELMRELNLSRHSKVVPLAGVLPEKKNGRQVDGSIWSDGMCISPAADSESAKELRAYYDQHGVYTGD